MSKEEIQNRIDELKNKLYELNATVEEKRSYDARGLDVYGETVKTTVGNKQEIEQVKREIDRLEKQLKTAKTEREIEEAERKRAQDRKDTNDFVERERKAREEQEKQQAKKDKEKHKRALKEVKKEYRKQNPVGRLIWRLNKSAPNWKKIKQTFTTEELEYLLKVGRGNTEERQKAWEGYQARNQELPRSKREKFTKLKKEYKKSNLSQMSWLATHKQLLENKVGQEHGRIK